MTKISFASEYFDVKDTLFCGQIFRFKTVDNGYMVYTLDKCAYVETAGDTTTVFCEDFDKDYFERFFDLSRDYASICASAKLSGNEFLAECAKYGKGIRILNQDKTEMLFSFIISQNNNIPRIKGIIERLCAALGEKKLFMGKEYHAFPSVEKMAAQPLEFYTSIGLGYRAEYVRRLAVEIANGLDINAYSALPTEGLKRRLIALYGVGPKVADCVTLFGYHRADSFPVDTWIYKVYRENFNGTLTNREKISKWFLSRFNENAGYFQQYLFHYKRIKEKIEQQTQKSE